MTIDLAALQTEIINDPTALGLSQTDNSLTASLLNETRAAVQIDRDIIDTWEVIEATTPSEYLALNNAEEARYNMLISAGTISVRGPNVRASFAALFDAQTTTRPNLLALQTRDGSRAEELFGESATVRPKHVNEALNS